MFISAHSPWSHFLTDFIWETLSIHLVRGGAGRGTSQISKFMNIKILVQAHNFLYVESYLFPELTIN